MVLKNKADKARNAYGLGWWSDLSGYGDSLDQQEYKHLMRSLRTNVGWFFVERLVDDPIRIGCKKIHVT